MTISSKQKKERNKIFDLMTKNGILKNESGIRFYHRALSPKAKKHKKVRRMLEKIGRRSNRYV